MGKRLKITLLILLLAVSGAMAQHHDRDRYQRAVVENGDTIVVVNIRPIHKYASRRQNKRYNRMVRAVIKVYPLAEEARREIALLDEEFRRLPSKRDRQAYSKGVQKMLIKKYTPVIKKMTIYEGTVLLKLIDRQTEQTGYDIIKEFRGGFVASFWQSMAKLFGNNLKLEYDTEKDDAVLEQVVRAYEAGRL